MKYKISDNLLKLKEYGRNVQMMVEEAKKIEDPEKRNSLVWEIVRIMSNLHPYIKEMPDYRQKLWDSLYLLADFDIDIKGEFPVPEPETYNARPTKRLSYSNDRPRYRQYGNNVDQMVARAIEMEAGEEKHALVSLIANIMRMHLRDEKDSHAEAIVTEHLKKLSDNKLIIKPGEVRFYKPPKEPKQQQQQHRSNHKRKKGKRSNYRR